MKFGRLFVGFLLLSVAGIGIAAEVFEVGEDRFEELPGGKEADGIVGDFVLRNDKVEAVISGNLPLRRPNMSAFYGDGNETPGCLYDLTLVGKDNDQITIFTPSAQRGVVSYVKIRDGLEDGLVGVETVLTPEKGGGLGKEHLYLLKEGWRGVLIVSTFRNESSSERKISVKDGWTQMRSKGSIKGIQWADAIDPADKCGYAYAWVEERGGKLPKADTVTLGPGQVMKISRFLAVGTSPADAVGIVAERRNPVDTGKLALTLTGPEGPAIRARVGLTLADEKEIFAYPDEKGEIAITWPVGTHPMKIEDLGRDTVAQEVSVSASEPTSHSFSLSTQSRVAFVITDEKGGDTPCKIQFHAMKGTPKVKLGPTDRDLPVSMAPQCSQLLHLR